jgi:flagellar motor protein MotB
MRPGRAQSARGDDDSYLASVSDLMVGLLFVFIIMLMAFALNYRTAEQRTATVGVELSSALDEAKSSRDAAVAERKRLDIEIDDLEAQQQTLQQQLAAVVRQRDALGQMSESLAERDMVRSALLQRVRDLLAERAVDVSIEPENGILRLPEDLLFESGASALREDGERALREVASALARSLPCYSLAPAPTQVDCKLGVRPILEAVLVEGHTDSRPFAAGGGDNWMLAALRGVNTFKALVRYEPTLDMLRNARGEALLGVSSYEARRPVAHDASAEAQRLNRRIDLRFVVAAPAGEELEQLRRTIQQPVPN